MFLTNGPTSKSASPSPVYPPGKNSHTPFTAQYEARALLSQGGARRPRDLGPCLPAAKEALKRAVLAILTISFIYELERECSNGAEQTRDRHSAPEPHDRAQR